MSTMDMPADEPVSAESARTKQIPKTVWISWIALAMMTTSSVASLRAAPTMAVYGLACVFLYIVPAIVFLIPTSLVWPSSPPATPAVSTTGSRAASPSRWGSSPSGASSP